MSDPLGDSLRETERRRLKALVERDMPTADALHAETYALITPGGGVYSKADYLSGVASGALRYRQFEPDGEIAVRTWGIGAAVRYPVLIDIEWEGGHESGRYWHTDIYELIDGRWQAVWSQATHIPSRS